MRSNRHQPNPDKTKLLWCETAQRLHQLPTSPLLIDGCSVAPVSSARDLGVYIDSDPRMRTHVQRTECREASPPHTSSATPDPSLCTVEHSSDVVGRTGTFTAGLWEWRASQPSGLLDAPTPVGHIFMVT